MNTTLLITRPFSDPATCYLFYWSKIVIESAKNTGFSVIDLKDKRANKKEFESIIKKTKPILVMFNGHGSGDCIYGNNGEKILIKDENDHLLEYKIIYVLACETAKSLGPSCIIKRALAYIGYKEVYIFTHIQDKVFKPLEDKEAGLYLSASNEIMLSLIKGLTAKEAVDRARTVYLRNIQKVLSGGSSQAYIARWLAWDMVNLTCLGDEHAST